MRIIALTLMAMSLLCPGIAISSKVDKTNSPKQSRNESQTLNFDIKDGLWNVNDKRRPVIETSVSDTNYFTLSNTSQTTSLNLVIPKIEYAVLAKNGIALTTPILVSEEDSNKSVLWLEPSSDLTISFNNDLVNTPLQAIVSVYKKKLDAVAIFGPKGSTSFSLSRSVNTTKASNKELGLKTLSLPPENKKHSKVLHIGSVTENLSAGWRYHIKNEQKAFKLVFTENVFVKRRNEFIGGSEYWTHQLILFPGESIDFITPSKTL